ncbi:MAG: recombination protein O N-terminal domain-containing protein [Bacteroidales bacterium]|jgi:DNA repair protein RecO (recombination protein O)|nr:recombination protein O N-terminal domain-containing protein [Bacteroidales bacterium]MCI2133675.1 recombination protein O N-terminal domain-containing protein [Bacteroidales bacterium]
MNTKAELIVLNHTKFGENTIILHTLSNEYGRRGFLVRVGAKSSMALFLPMNILEAEISESPKSQLWRASNFVCLSPLNGIRGDIRKNTMTVFMSEVLYRAILEDTNEGGLASWLKQEILTLDALESDFSNFHLLFLLDLCAALGFSPSLPGLAPFAGTQLSNIEALLQAYLPSPADSLRFQSDSLRLPSEATPPAEYGNRLVSALLLPLKGTDRNEIAEAIIRYISYHTETNLNIRSLAILREIFG